MSFINIIQKIISVIAKIPVKSIFNLIGKGAGKFGNAVSSFNYLQITKNGIGSILNYYNKFVTNQNIKDLSKINNSNVLNIMNARDRDLKLNLAFGSNKRANFLFLSVIFLFIFSVFVLFFYIDEISYEGIVLLTGFIGFLMKCIYKAFNFEFGGDVDETISQTVEMMNEAVSSQKQDAKNSQNSKKKN